MLSTISSLDRYRGCLLGGAVGDSLGAAVEFDGLDAIRARFGADGIREPAAAYGRVGAITDDTQMTLFTAEGLLQADARLDRGIGNPPAVVWMAYQRWLKTQGEEASGSDYLLGFGELVHIEALHSRRAPGATCLSALKIPREHDFDTPAANDSKGCGGVMRAAPCGLVRGWYRDDVAFRIGVFCAALTHGHPTGMLAAGALAQIVAAITDGVPLEQAVAGAVESVGARPDGDEVARALDSATAAAKLAPSPETVERLGGGWIAEECLAIAVYSVLSHPDDFAAAVRLAANHSGDSDSTAAVAGNLAGALLGVQAIPPAWLEQLELHDTIDRLATDMHERFVVESRL